VACLVIVVAVLTLVVCLRRQRARAAGDRSAMANPLASVLPPMPPMPPMPLVAAVGLATAAVTLAAVALHTATWMTLALAPPDLDADDVQVVATIGPRTGCGDLAIAGISWSGCDTWDYLCGTSSGTALLNAINAPCPVIRAAEPLAITTVVLASIVLASLLATAVLRVGMPTWALVITAALALGAASASIGVVVGFSEAVQLGDVPVQLASRSGLNALAAAAACLLVLVFLAPWALRAKAPSPATPPALAPMIVQA
jgi:hypothetical protein